MQRGKYIEVKWTLESGEQAWWPAMVWSARPDTGELQLAYARAHGHPAHLAASYLIDDNHLLDVEQQLYLQHRPAENDIHFSADEEVLNQNDIQDEQDEIQEAQRALRQDVPADHQQRLWDGMEAFRRAVRQGLSRHGGGVITEEDVKNMLA